MPSPQRASARETITAQVAYWLVLVGVLFFYSGKGKLFDDKGHAPQR
jgi:hypothetical protein